MGELISMSSMVDLPKRAQNILNLRSLLQHGRSVAVVTRKFLTILVGPVVWISASHFRGRG